VSRGDPWKFKPHNAGPLRLPELVRCPVSWWLEPTYQQDRAAFKDKAAEEEKRMRLRGLHADREGKS
jgi:hypothetical protein